MAELLSLRGRSALSPFRVSKLLSSLARTSIREVSAEHWHFVHAARALSEPELGVLERILAYGPRGDSVAAGDASLLVVPRPGTISPWSSKATDIARNCGLQAVMRIERGTLFRLTLASGAALSAADREALLPLVHDRMTEAVLPALDDAARLFERIAPRALETIALLEHGAGAIVEADRALGLALSPDEVEYLADYFRRLGRDPSDVELMMFAQANSEHCRHKIFNADWIIDGVVQAQSLFAMIRHTHALAPQGTIVAYADNAAVMDGAVAERFHPDATRRYAAHAGRTHILMKVETHNHPTAIAPFPGAATGAGGEIRDEGATGTGAKPKAGLTGFTTSHLEIAQLPQPWEIHYGRPGRMASALAIMLEGPVGAASFNNEFGRPNLLGYFRTFEWREDGAASAHAHGYHKPIMIAGGVGNIAAGHTHKTPLPPGALVVALGGPAMRIGIGGGAASSMPTGANTEALDYDSVQRGNAEMQRRAQEVIDRCWQLGADNPIISIHDVGAGGLSNALPELVQSGSTGRGGGAFELRSVPSEEPGMSPREIWCNEAQERYVLAVPPARMAEFTAICARERCPCAVVGEARGDDVLRVEDAAFANRPVDMQLSVLLGKPPRMTRDVRRAPTRRNAFDTDGIELGEALHRVLAFPAVADKTFLVTIGDRTVGGLSARDPMVGPWQVPVADVAVTLMDFEGYQGEAMAMGERTPLALLDACASARMAVAEALTNLAAANVGELSRVKLSANWMAAAGSPGQDAALYDAVRAVGMELCPALGISIPVGKDSMSMRTAWREGDVEKSMVSPVSLIVTAFAPIADARRTLTPFMRGPHPAHAGDASTLLLLVDLGNGANRLGGSCLAQVFGALGEAPPDVDDPLLLEGFFRTVQTLQERGIILAYHDRADGGLVVTLLEMAFASRCGLDIRLDELPGSALEALFSEELGAVLQVRHDERAEVVRAFEQAGLRAICVGVPIAGERIRIEREDVALLEASRVDLHRYWSATSHAMQRLRDNPAAADEEYARIADVDDPGLSPHLAFDPAAAPFIAAGARPRVAILREQGVNGHVEMAAALTRAGFDAYDVHMSDIVGGADTLGRYAGIVAGGGFSYGDVLGAGEGWAKSILFNASARDAFAGFFARGDTFALGVCNGCQMMSNLRELIPGSGHWPHFVRNRSEQFEARFVQVEVAATPSLFFSGMAGSRLPVALAHGEGYAEFRDDAQRTDARPLVTLRFVDHRGAATERYPFNPNGSPEGITGLTTADGRFSILMPHPERVFRSVQMSWHPPEWSEDSPWMRMFRNARSAVG